MALPLSFLQHLRRDGYHPRSNKHSNALARSIIGDLTANCPLMSTRAQVGNLVADLNFDLRYQTATWNVDLVLGTPPPGTLPPSDTSIHLMPPSTVEIAIEIKSVMTEHRKSVKNRKRDLEAHHEHTHNYSPDAIAGAVMVVNASQIFQSPLRPSQTSHRDPIGLVEHCLTEMRSLATSGGASRHGLDASTAIVVSMDNIDHESTTFVEGHPAPNIGDPLHYDSFIQRLCNEYRSRFADAG